MGPRAIRAHPNQGISSTWIRWNKKVIIWCLNHSMIINALNIPKRPVIHLVDNLTFIWSIVIFVTSYIKLLNYPKPGGALEQGVDVPIDKFLESVRSSRARNGGAGECELQEIDFVLLNYLPCISRFASLYYGLVLLTIGTTLIWRFYLRLAGLLEARKSHKHSKRFGVARFDAIRELVNFFMNPPNLSNATSHYLDHRHHNHHHHHQNEQIDQFLEWRDNFRDTPQQRWRFLALRVAGFLVFLFFTALPVYLLLTVAFHWANVLFGPLEEAGLRLEWRQARILALRVYGYLEQAYVLMQGSMFFVMANIFIMLLYADLCFEAGRIQNALRHLRELYIRDPHYSPAMPLIRKHQILIMAHFNLISRYDEFVSRFSLVALAMITVGLSFSQSFFLISDDLLRRATLLAFAGNLLSFSFLFVLSEHVRRQCIPLQKYLLSIIYLEKRPEERHEWYRMVHRLFRPDRFRTFTINGHASVDFLCYSKIVLTLLAGCLIIDRSFYRPYRHPGAS